MMTNVYHSEILHLLLRCGKAGMRVADISRYVFNIHVGLFVDDLRYDDLHQTIRCYLWRQSKLRRSPFMRVKYGMYAIKDDMAIQLDFDFDHPESYQQDMDEEDANRAKDKAKNNHDDSQQLLLFPDFF